MHPLASLQTQNSPPRRIRHCVCWREAFKGPVPEKVFDSLFVSLFFNINEKKVITAPLSSYYKARQIANILKEWI
jgi:hypothetical protein